MLLYENVIEKAKSGDVAVNVSGKINKIVFTFNFGQIK